MPVTELSYVGLRSTDADGWSSILTEIVGLQKFRRDTAGADLYRMDEFEYRIFIEDADEDGVAALGWGVSDRASLDDISERINDLGVVVRDASPELLARRGARALRTFTDPAGFPIELSLNPPSTVTPFIPGRAMSGFKTGPLGLGHAVLHCANHEDEIDFYCRALGFRISDYIVWADADAAFLRCNMRHHSLAIINEALGMSAGALNHIQFEMNSLADVGTAYDIVLERQLPVIMSLGQHSNDKMTSFYFAAPGGVGIEVGWNGQTIENDDDWRITKYDDTKIWGHQMGGLAG